MTDPKTSPGQFLMEASEAYDKRKLHQLELQKLKDENLRFSRELEKLRASIDKEKNGVIDRRRGDIEAEYEKQLRSLDNSIRELTEKRKKARDLGVKNRIKSETAELYQGCTMRFSCQGAPGNFWWPSCALQWYLYCCRSYSCWPYRERGRWRAY